MPRVSVIVPSYNHAAYLRACLQSVRAQTFEDWELILIDDCSTDDSFAIAESIAAQDPRIQALRNGENLGTYGTQAKAVDLASGEFVAVINSDDLWEPSKLAAQVTLMERHSQMPCCYTLGWLANADGTLSHQNTHGDWPTDFVQELLPMLLVENRILASSVLFRREQAQFDPSLRYSGDWVSLLQAAVQSPVGCIPARLSHWRQHDTNTYRRSPGQVAEEIRVRCAILDSERQWFVSRIPRSAIRDSLARCSSHLSALLVLSGDSILARKYALMAFKLGRGKAAGLRRLAICFLPNRLARARLWPSDNNFIASPADLRPIRWQH